MICWRLTVNAPFRPITSIIFLSGIRCPCLFFWSDSEQEYVPGDALTSNLEPLPNRISQKKASKANLKGGAGEGSSNKLVGKTVVFTGKLTSMTRKEATNLVEKMGGKVCFKLKIVECKTFVHVLLGCRVDFQKHGYRGYWRKCWCSKNEKS